MKSLRDLQKTWQCANFVGRNEELAVISAALAGQSATRVFLLTAPGGFGKTALLLKIAERAPERVTYVDARDLSSTPEQVLAASAPAFQCGSLPHALLIDTADRIAPLDGWLRESFVPSLPAQVVLVIASRTSPSPAWRTVPGFGTLIVPLSLGGLSDREAGEFLALRETAAELRPSVIRFARGMPLALTLAADGAARSPDFMLRGEPPVDLVQALVHDLVLHAPSARYRAALEAAAIVRTTSEPLLAALIDDGPVAELYEWLAQLSFFQANSDGVFPHDVAREMLAADLRWRDPDRYAGYIDRANTYLLQRIQRSSITDQQQLCGDMAFLHRHAPLVGGAVDWDALSGLRVELARPADHAALRAMVELHEGAESAALFDRIFESSRDSVMVFRDGGVEPAGMRATVRLDRLDPALIAGDRALSAVAAHIQQLGPLRPGESALVERFWMARDTYQQLSPVQTAGLPILIRMFASTEGLRYAYYVDADPEFWMPLCSYLGIHRAEGFDFTVGKSLYGLYYNDFRAIRPVDYLSWVVKQASARSPDSQPLPAPPVVRPTREELGQLLRDALRQLAAPGGLARNPLVDARIAWSRAGAGSERRDRTESLRALIIERIDALQKVARNEPMYRTLHSTYVDPLPVQKQVADALGMPWSTYRHHLSRGVEHLIEDLWQLETG